MTLAQYSFIIMDGVNGNNGQYDQYNISINTQYDTVLHNILNNTHINLITRQSIQQRVHVYYKLDRG